MKVNCLTRALDQWAENPNIFRLWYNNNHVITLEGCYDGRVLKHGGATYLPLDDYGMVYFDSAFKDWLKPKYRKLLLKYMDSLRD